VIGRTISSSIGYGVRSASLRHAGSPYRLDPSTTERLSEDAPVPNGAGPFEAFATRWLESSMPASNRKQTTKVLYAGLSRNHIIGSDLGNLPMKNLRPSSVERLVTQQSIKGDGHMARSSFGTVRRPRVTTTEAKFLEPHQIGQLLEAAYARYRARIG
jgi:hypothetical protein